jgi:hypoxanthine phosphoribosyltransferase
MTGDLSQAYQIIESEKHMATIPDLRFIDFPNFNRLSFQLAQSVIASGDTYEEIVSISRGGALLARILSDLLDLPVLNIGLRSYQGIGQKGEIVVYQPLTQGIAGKKVLLVDEICDSGRTFEVALANLKGLEPALLKSACLFAKPHSAYKPDFVAEATDQWVVFPYEWAETIRELKPLIHENIGVREQFEAFTKSIGLTKEQQEGELSRN